MSIPLTESELKERLASLLRDAPDVHVTISLSRPRLQLTDLPARLEGVYPHIFRLSVNTDGIVQHYSHPYTDVMIGKVVIKELDK